MMGNGDFPLYGRPLLLGATLLLALLAGLPDPSPGVAGERLHRWTTRADFEGGSGAGVGEFPGYNIDTASRPGDIMLEEPLVFDGLAGGNVLLLKAIPMGPTYDLAANTGTGEYLVVWRRTNRQGEKLMSLPAGRDGRALGEPSVVAELPGGANGVALAFNPEEGNFLVVWADASYTPSIFSLLVGADGRPLGKDVLISRGPGSKAGIQVAWNSRTAGYLAVWQEKREGRNGLLAFELDGAGKAVGEEKNLIPGSHSRENPQLIPAGEGGTFALVWEDHRAGNGDIYFRKIGSDGSPVGAETVLTSREWHEKAPSVARRGRDGAYFVVWEDHRHVKPAEKSMMALWDIRTPRRGIDLHGAGLDAGGRVTKESFVVSGELYHQSHPRVFSPDSTDQFVVIWQDGRRTYENWDIYARPFNPSLLPAAGEIPVATMPDEQFRPLAAYLPGPGEALLIWESVNSRGEPTSFYAQRFDGARPGRGVLRGLTIDSGTKWPEWGKAFWIGDVPAAAVAFRTRSAATEKELAQASWSDYADQAGAPITSPSRRWMEVEILLSSLDGKSTPVLHSFTVSYRD